VEDAATPSVAAVLEDIAREADHAALFQGYALPGLDEHRRAGAAWIARSGLDADPARTLVTGGAQHALAVALASLVGAGDVVLAETVSYAGIRALSSAFGLRLEPVAIDAGGLVPEALEAACKRLAPKVLYCMPTLQNPTGTVLSEERRAAIAATARRHGVVILEDDTYGPLCPDAPAPLACHAPERTYFVSSTSKTLAAGLRVGYLHAPLAESGPSQLAILERLVASLTGLGWMSAPLTAEIAARWIRQGVAERILARKREEIRLRREVFERRLGRLGTISHPASCHAWVALPEPWRSEELVAEAARRGVSISSTELFVIGRANTPHAVRLCLGTPRSRAELEQGLGIVAEILASPPGARPTIV
jgi:DNA-binding transcriptional MocR family regulator